MSNCLRHLHTAVGASSDSHILRNRLLSHYHTRPMSQSTPLLATPKPRSSALPIAILVLCCLFWGYSFPAMQLSATIFEKSLPNNVYTVERTRDELAARSIFNAWRFALASAGFL